MEILNTIAQLCTGVEHYLPQWLNVKTPQGFLTMEEEAHALGRRLVDGLTGAILCQRLQDPELTSDAVSRAQQTGEYKPNGSRDTKVTLLGGTIVALRTPYMPPVRKGRRRRGRRPAGLWPVLAMLGIWWETTPALCSEINRQVTDSTSFRDGLAALERRGINLEYKRTLKLVQRFGRRAVEQRCRWLEHILDPATPAGEGNLAGKTVLVGVDGGRLRQRHTKRGRRKKSGHHGYETPWCEPRQLVVNVLDQQGRVDRTILPLYDATQDNADGMMRLLAGYLKALGVHQAQRLVTVADGAHWIWNRLEELYETVNIDRSKVFEVIDWSHAVSTLHDIVKECRWSEKRRTQWVARVKRALFAGCIDSVLYSIRQIAKGRRAKAILSHRDYFDRNRHRMQYRCACGCDRRRLGGQADVGEKWPTSTWATNQEQNPTARQFHHDINSLQLRKS